MTDLYDTEGAGDFAGSSFFARPVVGGHFSFVALDRACDGKAAGGLEFLNKGDVKGFGGEKAVAESAKQQGEL
jgi:hypothetical protein